MAAEIIGKTVDGKSVINGAFVFKLMDTRGLPLEIITDGLRERNMVFDVAGFVEAADRSGNYKPGVLKERLKEVLPGDAVDILVDRIYRAA